MEEIILSGNEVPISSQVRLFITSKFHFQNNSVREMWDPRTWIYSDGKVSRNRLAGIEIEIVSRHPVDGAVGDKVMSRYNA